MIEFLLALVAPESATDSEIALYTTGVELYVQQMPYSGVYSPVQFGRDAEAAYAQCGKDALALNQALAEHLHGDWTAVCVALPDH